MASWIASMGQGRAKKLPATFDAYDPQVVVIFDPFGAYGHPDHIAIFNPQRRRSCGHDGRATCRSSTTSSTATKIGGVSGGIEDADVKG